MNNQTSYVKNYLSDTLKRLKDQFGGENVIFALQNTTNEQFYYNLELEEIVIGSLLLEKDSYYKVADILKPEYFYEDNNINIYKAVQKMTSENLPVDILTVCKFLQSTNPAFGFNGFTYSYVANLTNRIGSAANLEYHSIIIAQLYMKREVNKLCRAVIEMLKPNDISETMDFMMSAIDKIEAVSSIKQARSSLEIGKEVVDDYITKFHKYMNNNEQPGISCGFNALDRKFRRNEPGELIIIAARPSMGKTSLALSMAINISKLGVPVAFFSLEMTEMQLLTRMASMELKLSYSDISELKIDDQDKLNTFNNLTWADYPLYIDDTAAINNYEFESKLRRLIMKFGVKVVFLDYLQLMTSNEFTGNKTQEITYISSNLKKTAKKLGIPVIALSQLSRSVESRADKRPQLSDLRESGAIEQDADKVAFLYRELYYDSELRDSPVQETEIIYAKNRNGCTGTVKLTFNTASTLFTENEVDIPF